LVAAISVPVGADGHDPLPVEHWPPVHGFGMYVAAAWPPGMSST
jgi:hypothetical protein